MGLFIRRTPEQKEARREAVRTLNAAEAELERVSERDRAETEDYHRANEAVWAALESPHIPWWRR